MSSSYDRKDKFYQRAKDEGFRSRAAYKLSEINDRFKLLGPNKKVLELGAWPGSWTQVVLNILGEKGRIAALDLQTIDPISDDRLFFITGDCRDAEVISKCLEFLGDKADVVLSDMSPKLTGIPEADQAMAVSCGELTQNASISALKKGGDMVVKLFKGRDVDGFVKTVNRMFNKVTRAELQSTRETSNEFYLVARGFKG